MTAYARFAPIWITAAVLIFAPSAQAHDPGRRAGSRARGSATRATQVRAALGKPIKIRTLKNDFGPYVEYRFAGGIRVTFQGKTQRHGGHDHGQERPDHERRSASARPRTRCRRRSRASSARASARRAPATPATFARRQDRDRLPDRERERDQRHRRHRDRLGQAPELAGQADPVEDRLRLLARARAPVRGPGGRRTSARASSASVARSTSSPVVTSLPRPEEPHRRSGEARCRPTSARRGRARGRRRRRRPSRRERDALRGDRRVAQAERGDDPERVPRAVAPPGAAAGVDARAVGVVGERVRHQDARRARRARRRAGRRASCRSASGERRARRAKASKSARRSSRSCSSIALNS